MRGWIHKINIKPFITEDTSAEAIVKAGHGIAKALRAELPECYFILNEDMSNDILVEVIEYFEWLEVDLIDDEVEELEIFNYSLSSLYDYCDDNRIWLGL